MPRQLFCKSLFVLLFTTLLFAQSQNASLDGRVTDKSGAVIPQASVTITAAERALSSTIQTDNDGRYAFPNLAPGTYNLSIAAKGFRTYEQRSIQLLANQSASIDAGLEVGDASTKIEVSADAAQLNYDNGTQQEGVPPQIINQLPLLVSAGTPRNAVQFVTFLPGVNTGTSVQPLQLPYQWRSEDGRRSRDGRRQHAGRHHVAEWNGLLL